MKTHISAVIPVFNSEKTVRKVVERTLQVFSKINGDHEVILVNDGSSDGSWKVISQLASEHASVKAFNLLKNYGQHAANLCGFRASSGEYVVTLDDDLQNPPEEIEKLLEKAVQGHDLVFGEFEQKKHSLFRRLGSSVVQLINTRVFGKPRNIRMSNFRMIHRSVVERVIEYKSAYPYIPGMLLMFSSSMANVPVRHEDRKEGKSNYTLRKIVSLVAAILFNYSSFPLRMVAGIGLVLSLASLLLGTYYIIVALLEGVDVPGWTTIVVLLSFFNSVILMMLGMLGEYLVRLINQSSTQENYYIKDSIE